MSAPAINTNVRLFDLVRYMRQELHAEDLITDEEYSWLCMEAGMANDPKGGSPSPRRLEDYDKLREKNAALRAALQRALPVLKEHAEDESVFWGGTEHQVAKEAIEIHEQARAELEDNP